MEAWDEEEITSSATRKYIQRKTSDDVENRQGEYDIVRSRHKVQSHSDDQRWWDNMF